MSSGLLFKQEQQGYGPAFKFVEALKAVNAELTNHYPESEELFKVKLIDDSSSSDFLMNRIREHGLDRLITLLPVTEDQLVNELKRNNTHLYLSDEPNGLKVQEALNAGVAAAIMFTPTNIITESENQLRVAFDGDAVLFSNESELVFKSGGLQEYLKNEKQNVEIRMNEGPFRGFLEVLIKLQKKLHNRGLYKKCPIRTYLVTSRGAGYDGYRALNTLLTWGVELDEAVFVGGANKGPTLQRIKPHIFFDDQQRHVDAALEVGTVACLVLSPN
ncbi:cytosolic 5'-nucleotidase 1A-like isoform X2 [Astatotilapia calliptera]|nr:cytosolic 5'-nucleotidase 1A-like isoform X2 [Astatotilapia calliptera]XP_026027545.1 cytosolic 5'-nucleotidase 1A-like isoform X2 [Astatotilapia calliptera]XP_026027546.1 cytosolic 5'-nucleotidase 1A-like isoform X2 [Astatotilapia calliptera]